MKELRNGVKEQVIIKLTVKFKARRTEKLERWNRYEILFDEMYTEMKREVRNVKTETERGDINKKHKLT
jgi:hypothetical protein